MVEVLIEDFGYEELGKPVVKNFTGNKDSRLHRLSNESILWHFIKAKLLEDIANK